MSGETRTTEKAVALYEQHVADNFNERGIRHCLRDKDLACCVRSTSRARPAWCCRSRTRAWSDADRIGPQITLIKRMLNS
jgi:hypothetical protein